MEEEVKAILVDGSWRKETKIAEMRWYLEHQIKQPDTHVYGGLPLDMRSQF